MFSWFKKQAPAPPLGNVHHLLISRIGMIRPDRMNQVFSPNKSTYTVRLPQATVVDYSASLRILLQKVKGPKEIPDILFREMHRDIMLRDWYVVNNHYVDVIENTRILQGQMIELVTLYMDIEISQDPKDRKMAQQLSPVISSMKLLVDTLIEVSQHDVPENLFRDKWS